MTDHGPELDVTHARQARRGRHAFVILAASLALVVIGLAAVFAFNAGRLSSLRGNREAEPPVAQGVTVTPRPAKQVANAAAPQSVEDSGRAASRQEGAG